MSLKMRKLITGVSRAVFLAACPLLLSGCLMGPDPPIPPVSVAEVTMPAAAQDNPPLYCKIGRGSALFGRDWYDFKDVTFMLNRGVPADVRLTRIHSFQEMTIQALFDGSGQKLIFCPFLSVEQDQRISCSSLYALEDDLNDGIKRTFDIPSAVRGGSITCAFAQEKLRPLATGKN
jgi:hypothetical protein